MAKKIQIDLQVNDKGSKDVKKFAKTTNTSFKNVEQSAKKMNTGLSKVTKTLGLMAAAATALVAVKLVGFMQDAVTAASDLQEATGRLELIFGDLINVGSDMQKNLVDNFAMTRLEAANYLADLKGLLDTSGLLADESAGLSNRLVKLAADLGSAFNVSTANALAAIKSGLVGQSEPLLKFNVLVSEARVKEEALSMELVKSGKELTAQQKVLARSNIILKDANKYVGDLARTWGSYANVLKRYNRTLDNLKSTIGTALLPMLSKYIEKLEKWIELNEELVGKEFEETIKDLTQAMKDLADILGPINSAVQLFGGWIRTAAVAITVFVTLKLIGYLETVAEVFLKVYERIVRLTTKFLGLNKVTGAFLRIVAKLASWGTRIVGFFNTWALAIALIISILPQLGRSIRGLWEVVKGNLDWSDYLHANAKELRILLDQIDEINKKQIVKMPMPAMPEFTGNEMKKYVDAQLAAEEKMIKERKKLATKGELELIKLYEELFIRKSELLGEDKKAELAAEHYRYKYFVEANGKIRGAAEVHGLELQAIRDKYRDQDIASFTDYVDKMWEAEVAKANKLGEAAMKDQAIRDESLAKREAFEAHINEVILRNAQEQMEAQKALIDQWAASPMADMFTDWITGARTFKEAFSDMAMSIGRDLMRMAIKAMILKAIMTGLGNYPIGGVGGNVTTIRGGQGGGYGFAEGGIASGPESGYPVTLHGTEAIIPLGNNKKSGLGNSVTNNVTMNVTAAPGMSNEDATKQGRQMAKAFEAEVDKRMLYQMRPGGLLYSGGVR